MNNIDTLCFSTGGINSFAFCGALDYIINNDIINIKQIHTFVGSSGGAIIAYLLSIKYTINEIIYFITNNELKLKNFKFTNLFYNYGLDDGEKILSVLKFLLNNKINKNDITFIELYNLTNNNLIINGTKINNNKTEEILFNKNLTPNMSVITALRISISVPIIYTPIYHDNNYYIDGGISNKFPYNHCDSNKTLGFYVYCSNHINPLPIIFHSLLSKKNYYYKYIIFLHIHNPSEFNISYDYIKYLITLGKQKCKFQIENNFKQPFNSSYYFNHVYRILFFIFIVYIITKIYFIMVSP